MFWDFSPGKKYKQKGGQLFPRKSVEKKEKNIVVDNTKAFPTSPISTKSAFNHHHHHQPRNVEGFVGPGDIQFGSSPPNYDGESMEQNSLSQSTGSIPISVSQNKPTNRTLQLPVRPQQPPTWTQVSHPIPIAQQQRTLSQEKLTLLEQANFGAGNKQGFKSPEKIDERRGFHPPSFQPQTTPPRVASPTENRTNIPQVPIIATPGKRFERSGNTSRFNLINVTFHINLTMLSILWAFSCSRHSFVTLIVFVFVFCRHQASPFLIIVFRRWYCLCLRFSLPAASP